MVVRLGLDRLDGQHTVIMHIIIMYVAYELCMLHINIYVCLLKERVIMWMIIHTDIGPQNPMNLVSIFISIVMIARKRKNEATSLHYG